MTSRRAGLLLVVLVAIAAAVWIWTLSTVPARSEAAQASPDPGATASVPSGASAKRSPTRADAGAAETAPTLRLPPATLEPAPEAKAGAFAGRVVSATTGQPIAGAEVTLAGPSGGATSLVTDRDGRFEFVPDAPGTYQIASARADGFVPFGPEWGRSPLTIVAQAGVRVRDVVIALLPTAQVVVTVRDGSGRAVPGAHARVLYANAGEAALYPQKERFTADERGEFRIEASEGASVEAWHPELGAGGAAVDAPAIAAGKLEVQLRPTPEGRAQLSGRVLMPDGSGAPGALVWVRSANSAYPRTYGNPNGHRVLTDEEGRFELPDLEAGLYDVSAQLTGLGPARASDVRVPSASLILKLESGATLNGVVRDDAGRPVPAFAIDLRWNKGPLETFDYGQGTFVGPSGQYEMAGLREGRYTVNVLANGFVPKQASVTVPAGTSEVKADFSLERGGTVNGRVVTEGTRAPVVGARVAVEGLFESAALSTSYSAMTDAAGSFVLEGVPSSGASLLVSAPGHNSKVVTGVMPGAVEVALSPAAPDAGTKIELVGVGAVLKPRGNALVVGQVFPGGGAQEAGLQPGDEIVTIDGKAVVDIGWPAVVDLIRGEVGTRVIFGVRKAGKPPAVQVTVTRRKIGA